MSTRLARCLKVQNWSGLGAMNSNGTSTRLASRAAAPTRCRILENWRLVGGRVQGQRELAQVRLAPVELVVLPDQVDAVALDVLELEARGELQLGVEQDQGVDAAPRPAVDDADQPPDGVVVEVGREVGDDEDPERLGDLAGHRVVFLDRLELVAQVLLDHVLHVLGQVGQPLLDVGRLGPDPAGDQELVVVGQVHEGGEVLAQADRVDDREADLAGRDRRSGSGASAPGAGDGLVLAAVGGADEHASP